MEPGVPGLNFILAIRAVAMDTGIDIENVIVLHRLVEEEIATDLQPIVREDAIHRFVQVCFNFVSINVYGALVTSLWLLLLWRSRGTSGGMILGAKGNNLKLFSRPLTKAKILNFLQVSCTGKTISFQAVVLIDIIN